MKVLLTSTSFMDTPGKHQELLDRQGFTVDTLRGPIAESEIIKIIADYDAILCGDDELTRKVLEKGRAGKLRYISKYGVGLDKIDLEAAKEFNLPVTNCPNINQTSVAEHVFALLLTFVKNIHHEYSITKSGGWFRYIGNEIFGKTIGIVGLGAVGKEVAKRAIGFCLEVLAYDKIIDNQFVEEWNIKVANSLKDLVKVSDIVSLHIPHNLDTDKIINKDLISYFKNGLILINTARGKLVDLDDLKWGLDNKIIKGYLTDVLDKEPIPENYPMKEWENVLITPHIGSRTFESVEKQGIKAVENLINLINRGTNDIKI
ncbi:MAG: phosphoglycerate dehydrogenase, partial [Desulfobacterales bacterium]|nr:phosphoglycerate dehydrogenase [Desulfobacterales bacterium]